MNDLVVPSSTIPPVTLLQFTEPTLLVFACNVQPVDGDGPKTATSFVAVRKTDSEGEAGVCSV